MIKQLRFKMALHQRGLTQRELAHRLGINENMVSRIVHGYQLPTPHLAKTISKWLGVKVVELFPETKPY
jgi:transcriptional regulator with XRE-family HTH domain